MNDGSRLKNWVVRAFFASYMYALFKIIVLKFGVLLPSVISILSIRFRKRDVFPQSAKKLQSTAINSALQGKRLKPNVKEEDPMVK